MKFDVRDSRGNKIGSIEEDPLNGLRSFGYMLLLPVAVAIAVITLVDWGFVARFLIVAGLLVIPTTIAGGAIAGRSIARKAREGSQTEYEQYIAGSNYMSKAAAIIVPIAFAELAVAWFVA